MKLDPLVLAALDEKVGQQLPLIGRNVKGQTRIARCVASSEKGGSPTGCSCARGVRSACSLRAGGSHKKGGADPISEFEPVS